MRKKAYNNKYNIADLNNEIQRQSNKNGKGKQPEPQPK